MMVLLKIRNILWSTNLEPQDGIYATIKMEPQDGIYATIKMGSMLPSRWDLCYHQDGIYATIKMGSICYHQDGIYATIKPKLFSLVGTAGPIDAMYSVQLSSSISSWSMQPGA